jgi:hypothetical protein
MRNNTPPQRFRKIGFGGEGPSSQLSPRLACDRHGARATNRKYPCTKAMCHRIERRQLLSINGQITTIQRSARCGPHHNAIGGSNRLARRLIRIEPAIKVVADSLDSIRRPPPLSSYIEWKCGTHRALRWTVVTCPDSESGRDSPMQWHDRCDGLFPVCCTSCRFHASDDLDASGHRSHFRVSIIGPCTGG